jgi:hypothetical protein
MGFYCLLDLLRAADHARGRATQLDEVFANLGAIEHGVEGRHLIHTHGRHLHDTGDLIHGREGQPPAALSLGQIQQWDAGSLLVVGWVSRQNMVHLDKQKCKLQTLSRCTSSSTHPLIIFGGEIKESILSIIRCVDMRGIGMKITLNLSGSMEGGRLRGDGRSNTARNRFIVGQRSRRGGQQHSQHRDKDIYVD